MIGVCDVSEVSGTLKAPIENGIGFPVAADVATECSGPLDCT
jgi:hypothetical protein